MIPSSRAPLAAKYTIEQEMPHGFLGPTVLIKHRENKTLNICKICKKSFIHPADKINSFRQKIADIFQKKLPFVIPFTEVIETDEEFFLIRPYITYEPLSEYVHHANLSLDMIMEIWKGILNCVQILHSMSFYPLPLKPSNIFVLPNLTILFTDIYELSSDISWALQTPDPSQLAFVAPEYFLKTCQPSTFSDVWSLGMILCYICIHSLPFSTKNIFTMIKTITSNSFKIPCDLPPDIKYILSSIFILTPNQRPPVAFLRDPMVLKAHAGKHRRSSEPLNSKPMIECSSTNSIRLSARQVIDPHQRFFPRQTKINSANPRKYPFQQTSSFSVRCRFAAPTASKDSIETPI